VTTAFGGAPLLVDVASTTVLAHGSSRAGTGSRSLSDESEPTHRLLTLHSDSGL
jgi:hypothetical protein